MLLTLDPDQELFRDTTAKLLSEQVPFEQLRLLRDDQAGFDDGYWLRGAELGWTSLLVSEHDGGGSIGDHGLVDLALVAYEFGRHAAPGPLLVANVVVATLSETEGHGFDHVISDVLLGKSIVTWCLGEPNPNDRLGAIGLDIRVDGDDLVLQRREAAGGVRGPGRLSPGLRSHGGRADPGARSGGNRRACPSPRCRAST